MIKNYILIVSILLTSSTFFAQNRIQDIQSYKFNIKLSDDTDTIRVISTINGIAINRKLVLNLDDAMHIDSITGNKLRINFNRIADSLYISVPKNKFSVDIYYKGKPEDGLIIGKNKYGERTFFGDNWPDRAKYWLSVYDHPSDKAKVEFIVNAPKRYTVVSNGKLMKKY